MKCKNIELLSVEYLSGRLGPEKRKELEAHLSACSACRLALDEAKEAWSRLDGLPAEEPGPGLRARFDAMLRLAAEKQNPADVEKERHQRAESPFRLPQWAFGRPAIGFALPLALLAFGFLGGFAIRGALAGKGEVSVLRSEVTEMRRMLTLSLLNQTSSSERLRGVQVSRQAEGTDSSVLEALLNTLDGDPNTNVRLSAVDALFVFRDRPRVREALVHSLERQNSPLVQISIIDLLVEIREQKALNALRFLIQNDKTNSSVKERAEWGIQQLI
jgi:hypothetical protein